MQIITTQNKVYLLDGFNTIIESRIRNTYGIASDGNHIYLSEGDESLIKKYDLSLNFIEVVDTPELKDVHQIAFVDGDLLITNTGFDSFYSLKKGFFSITNKEPRIVKGKINNGEAFHLNSIFDEYILSAKGYLFDIKIGKRLFRIPYNIPIPEGESPYYKGWYHNLIKKDRWFYTCEKFNLVRFTETEFEVLRPLGGFLRGLAYINSQWWIGQSEFKERSERNKGDSRILILDDSFNQVNEITLKDSGQIRDIYELG